MKKSILLLLILVVLAGFNAIIYLSSTPELGFPLDDAWIHQVYARNIATRGKMIFTGGETSAGSTAPAWTLLLAFGYLIDIPHLYWAYLLGTLFAVLSAGLAALINHLYFGRAYSPMIVAIICMLEWHLAWAALSGMEIMLITFLSLLFFYMLKRISSPLFIGLVVGIAFMVRPESMLLAGIYVFQCISSNKENWQQLIYKSAIFLIGLVIVVGPLIIFNYATGGKPLPNTVQAKYLQYGYPWLPIKSIRFWLDVAKYFILGPLLLLSPFFLIMIYRAWYTRNKDLIYPIVWIISLVGLYSIYLPVIYHHGRYLMPLIPWIVIIGVEGLYVTVEHFQNLRKFWHVYQLTLLLMIGVLWINHSATYAIQVDLLRDNHGRIAEWINGNTSESAVIATHDIGILGYITERKIVDLAGLVTPEIIPIMLNQNELAGYTRKEGVEYFIVFSGYYKELLQATGAKLVLSPDSVRLRNLGLEPFEVYQIVKH